MSMQTYQITGYGTKIDYNNIDIIKYLNILEVDKELYDEINNKVKNGTYKTFLDMIDDLGWSLFEDFDTIINNIDYKRYIEFTHTEEDGDYLLYCPIYPWKLTEQERLMTDDSEIKKIITDILLLIYKDGITKKIIETNIDEINSYYIG